MTTLTLLNRATLVFASFYLRRAPTQFGRWRLINHCLPLLRQHGAGLGARVVKTRYGFKFHADLADWLGQYVYLTGAYEPPTARVIANLLQEADAMLDIGANAGFFSLLAASRVGRNGRVYSFEPVPTVRRRLAANVALNCFDSIVISEVALSDQPGQVDMYEGPEGHKGLSSLRPLEHAAQKITVRVERLDDRLNELPRIRLAKIDVEGAEQNVLLGMSSLLERDKPDIVLEITDSYLQQFGHSADELLSWLTARGYRAYRIDEQGLLPLSGPVPSSWPDQFNALFTTASRLPRRLQEMVYGH